MGGSTLLHYACEGNSRSAVIPLLLAHPDIDVNVKDRSGYTPFSYACGGRPSCVREMLKDSRAKVNEPAKIGLTPLHRAARYGSLDVIKWWIASGREMDLGEPGDVDKTDAIGKAKIMGNTEVVTLLERFKSDAAKTRGEVRLELGINGQYYSYYYYSILFLCLFSSFFHPQFMIFSIFFLPAIFSFRFNCKKPLFCSVFLPKVSYFVRGQNGKSSFINERDASCTRSFSGLPLSMSVSVSASVSASVFVS